MLLHRLFTQMLRTLPNAKEELSDLRQALLQNFDIDVLSPNYAQMNEHQQEWIRQQSVYGKELAEDFTTKVGRTIRHMD